MLNPFVLQNRALNAMAVKMANVQCNNSIRSKKETPFSRRTNEDTLNESKLDTQAL